MNQFFKCVLSCSIHVILLDSYFNLGAGIPSIAGYESDGSDDVKDGTIEKLQREIDECQKEIEARKEAHRVSKIAHLFTQLFMYILQLG